MIQDSTTVESPLPGGPAAVVRFLFNIPQWIQIAGFIAGVLVAIALLIYLWRKRQPIATWLRTREKGVKIGLAAAALVVLVLTVTAGTVSWNYMQHDNGFCTGCHIMEPPVRRMIDAEIRGITQKHDSLSCHACHQQSIFASARQLYLWVAERPEEIGEHAKVPTRICSECHVTGEARETWQNVAATAGHRVHLESDSVDLADVQCTTCHGQDVHRFIPGETTCGQSGCHTQEETDIRLGAMAEDSLVQGHCIACHEFTAGVVALATRDSASGVLMPGAPQCLGCHAMRERITFDPEKDPHSGKCAMCHDPHQQERPEESLKTCTTSGCHDNWEDEPFHSGANHRKVSEQCETCHDPHAARADASDCAGCHQTVRERSGGRRAPPMPFDTSAALRRISHAAPAPYADPLPAGASPAAIEVYVPRSKGDGPPARDAPPAVLVSLSPAAPDTFSHDQHKQLACLTCHTSTERRAGLTFERPRGCQICHHQAPARSDCAKCHQTAELAAPETTQVRVRVDTMPERLRRGAFSHAEHAERTCAECHTVPVTLAPATPVRECASCHDEHHAAGTECVACHNGAEMKPAHEPAQLTHQACTDCHVEATIARLTPTRTLCLTCHQKRIDHYPDRECTVCHLQASPEEYRSHLLGKRAT